MLLHASLLKLGLYSAICDPKLLRVLPKCIRAMYSNAEVQGSLCAMEEQAEAGGELICLSAPNGEVTVLLPGRTEEYHTGATSPPLFLSILE